MFLDDSKVISQSWSILFIEPTLRWRVLCLDTTSFGAELEQFGWSIISGSCLNIFVLDFYNLEIQSHSFDLFIYKSVANLKKESVGFDICHLDIAAKVTLDEAMEEEMSEQISGITISSDSQ